MNPITAWIEARKEIKLKKLELEQRQREIDEANRPAREAEEKMRNTWALVHREIETWSATGNYGQTVKAQVIFNLYENELGERRFEYDTTNPSFKQHEVVPKSSYYKIVCKPWLQGQYVKDIDTFEQAMQGRIIDQLKGK